MDKQRKEPHLEVMSPTDICTSEVVPMKGLTAEEPGRRNEIGVIDLETVEENYPPLTDDQMRAIRSAAPNPKPGSKLIKRHSLFR